MGDRRFAGRKKLHRRGHENDIRKSVKCRTNSGHTVVYHAGPSVVVVTVVTNRTGRMADLWVVPADWWRGLDTEHRRTVVMGWIRKAEFSDPTVDSRHSGYDDNMARDYPALHEYMTLKTGPDGKPRLTATLLVFCEDGMFKGCLNERDQGLALWASADSLEGLLKGLDGLLQADSTPWRKAKEKPGKGKKS